MNFNISLNLYFDASINLKFFFFFNTLSALLSNPFPIIISNYNLSNSSANFLLILKLQETTPPKALTGSQDKADL